MSLPDETPLKALQFYVTAPYPCGYLKGKLAQSLIASPQYMVTSQIYSSLIQQGFRRSGKFAYRPHCEFCRACIPSRVVLDRFLPNRSQKRAFKRHADLKATIQPVHFSEAHFALYQRYQAARHPETEQLFQAANPQEASELAAEQYRQFLCQSNIDSRMITFTDVSGAPKIVSVIDIVQDGISAVYTFYAPEDSASYGTFSIVWLAEWAKSLGLPYLYLGYWIENSPKMAYKQAYQPQQRLMAGEWCD